LNQYGSEELWFPQHDFNGTLWNNRENYERWDPARFAINWATPEVYFKSVFPDY
jgi:dipeptidyl aminopeptidase/acylaminoacyl peptidase